MQVRLLGTLEVVGDDGAPLPVQGPMVRALLAILALHCGRVVSTDRLIEDLWQDDAPAGVANALQRLISKVRGLFGSPDIVAMRPPGYALMIDADDVDVHALDSRLVAARAAATRGDLDEAVTRFVEAESLWRGPPLADFVYEEFAQPHIAHLHEVRVELIEDRIDAELTLARHSQLVSELDTFVRENPLRERLRGQLMLAMYRSGQQADALRVFQEGRTLLAEELGLEPGPELRQLETAILNHDPSLAAPAPAVASRLTPPTARRRTNVRTPLTTLIGRGGELAELAGLLEAHRLVTIVGPGGAGKTRLATEITRDVAEQHRDGAFMVELAAIGDPDAVAGAIAATLELPDSDADPLTRVRQHCEDADMLVVLDNCEHLVDAVARIAEVLVQSSRRLRILVTSREALRVPGEVILALPPLDVADAVELFVQRAAAIDASFAPDEAARGAAAEICTRLDGLPLAVELAAARTRAFSVAQIAERLDDRFRLLTGGARTAMARQQTLRAVVDWSYDLLFEDERRAFERLSVFPGGCVIGAAEVVCAGAGVDVDDVVELVASLVDKSLLVVDRSGPEPRYRMLQTLCQYGRERLVERGDADLVFGRMAGYVAGLCARSRDAFRGIDQRQWFRTIDAEQDNIRAAFEWAVGAGDKQLAVAIAADLTFQRWVGGGAAEGFRWLEVALAMAGDVAPFTYGRGLVWRAFLGFIAGHRDDLDRQFDEGIALLREHGDGVLVGYALSFYSQVVGTMGRLDKATELNVEILEELRSCADDPWVHAAQTWTQAALALQQRGDFDTFESLLREALLDFRDAGDHFMSAVCLDLVAELDETRGELDEATAALRAALDMVTGWPMTIFECALMSRLARLAVQTGHDDAEELVQRAFARAEELSYEPARAQTLNALADLRRRQGQLDDAEAAAVDALASYDSAPQRQSSSSFSRAPTPFDTPVGASAALSVLGFVAEARGDAAAAIECQRASYDRVAMTAHPRAVPLALEGLAAAAVLAGEDVWAAELLGCADQIRTATRAVRAPTEQLDADRISSVAATRLGPAAFAAAHAQGSTRPADAVVTAGAGS